MQSIFCLFTSFILFVLGRDEVKINIVESYLKANNLFRDFTNPDQDPEFSEVGKIVFIFPFNFLEQFIFWMINATISNLGVGM